MAYKILVIDDSEIVRNVLVRSINMSGFPASKIYQASNGIEALKILRKNWIDIIFSDIHMTEMTGIELLKVVKESSDLKGIPMIIISTEGSSTRIEDLKKLGISGYIRKPFSPEIIRDVIIEVMGEWE